MIVVMQARVCSTRLPGKAFFTFFGQTMIERACAIAKEINGVDRVILATGDKPENQHMRPLVERMDVEFFVGNEDNVLERFYRAIEGYEGEYLLRMTCDNYLIQPDVIEGLHRAAQDHNADYAYIAPLSHFSGEIVRCSVLRECYESNAYSDEAKEHVTWDIRNRTKNANIVSLPNDYLGLKHQNGFTLDTLQDLLTMKELERTFPELRETRSVEQLIEIQSKITTHP